MGARGENTSIIHDILHGNCAMVTLQNLQISSLQIGNWKLETWTSWSDVVGVSGFVDASRPSFCTAKQKGEEPCFQAQESKVVSRKFCRELEHIFRHKNETSDAPRMPSWDAAACLE